MSVKRSSLDHPTGLWSVQHLWPTGILLPAERHAGVMVRLVSRVSPPLPLPCPTRPEAHVCRGGGQMRQPGHSGVSTQTTWATCLSLSRLAVERKAGRGAGWGEWMVQGDPNGEGWEAHEPPSAPPHRCVDDDEQEEGEGRHTASHDECHGWHDHLLHVLGGKGQGWISPQETGLGIWGEPKPCTDCTPGPSCPVALPPYSPSLSLWALVQPSGQPVTPYLPCSSYLLTPSPPDPLPSDPVTF